MSVNVISLAIAAPSVKRWDRKRDKENYVQYQKLRFAQTGKLETASLRIESQKSGKALIITAVQTIETTAENVLTHMAEILEIGRGLPLLKGIAQTTHVVQYAGNLPDYRQKNPTRAEEYAERLRKDRWDVRRNGDPSEWRLTRV